MLPNMYINMKQVCIKILLYCYQIVVELRHANQFE
jgi:hypothetical protein